MKKIMYVAAIAFCSVTLMSCNNSKKTDASNSNADTTQVADMHTAETSLDYFGEYKGTIPAADCPGIKQTLVLNKDNTFTLNSIYIDRKDADFNDSGTFSINGNILTLKPKDGQESYYKVEEGRVVMLMADKQPVTGDLAEHYVLKQEKVF